MKIFIYPIIGILISMNFSIAQIMESKNNNEPKSNKMLYHIELDTIQHIRWSAMLSLDKAIAMDSLKYTYYWTDHIAWDYDLNRMTATWIGGQNKQTFIIRKFSRTNEILKFEIGNENETGWIDILKIMPNKSILLTSENEDLVNGMRDGSFTRNAILTEQ